MTLRKKLGLLTLAVSLILAAGCGTTPQESAPAESSASSASSSASSAQPAKEEPARVIAADDFSNLALSAPDVPVFDKYTIAQRREKGLPTELPEIAPYREGRVAYLTFDDGPDARNTPAILDILKENGIKATFYITGAQAEAHPDVVKRIYEEGHAIGNHSYDHHYEKLYPSVDGFLGQMMHTDDIIYSIIGVRPLNLRAPGGVVSQFTSAYPPALKANGYVEHDWNVSVGDAAPGNPVAQNFIDNVLTQTEHPATAHTAIVLMHSNEGHLETVKALPEIIRVLKDKGYSFGVVTPMTPQPW